MTRHPREWALARSLADFGGRAFDRLVDDGTVTAHVREVESEVERLIADGRARRRHLYRS